MMLSECGNWSGPPREEEEEEGNDEGSSGPESGTIDPAWEIKVDHFHSDQDAK